MRKRDQEISAVLGNVGFVFEVFKAIAHAVLVKGGTMEHLRRVVKEFELQRQIADLIVLADPDTDRPLCKGEYRVFVSYAPLPSKTELEVEFGSGYVSDIFDGRSFEKHVSCANMDETPEEKIFLVKHFGRETESEANIIEMYTLGYRPATHIEAYEFQKAHPEFRCPFWIIALGSSTMFDDYRYVAWLNVDDCQLIFGGSRFKSQWDKSHRFLFVRM